MTAKTAAYGSWSSPVTTELLLQDSVRLGGVALDGDHAYWIEGRPAEEGRNVLVRRRTDGTVEDVTPAPYNVRSRVHEYGGGAFCVHGERVWFVNDGDQRIYHLAPGQTPRPLTAPDAERYADFVVDAARSRLICIREHHPSAGREPVNELVSVGVETGAVEVLSAGHDFYAAPALSPGGDQLAWITWDHPDMPWDSSRLWIASLDPHGTPGDERLVAGGDGIAVFQPTWSPDGRLYVVSDPAGWWNLFRWDGRELGCVLEMSAELGRPHWQFAIRTYGFEPDGRVLGALCEGGEWRLIRLDPRSGEIEPVRAEFTDIADLAVGPSSALLVASSPRRAAAVVEMPRAGGEMSVLRQSVPAGIGEGYVSLAEPVTFPTGDGDTCHGFFYPPGNPDHAGPEGALAPLIVLAHGGPTGATSTGLDLRIQYWTTRGFAVLDVNYRGSTGYGRHYRDALHGRWGVADVEDCVNGVRYLVAAGRVDRERLAIRGGSAGGYTTLAALTFHDVFRAGASYYGISELEALARETHKFESRYLDRLIGPYPDRADIYQERSPINHIDRLSCPVIFFQGLEDKVVPPNQAQMMVDALRAKGLPVAHLTFEGEQHGFRKASTIKRALEAELSFYGQVFGFTPADPIEPVAIDNL